MAIEVRRVLASTQAILPLERFGVRELEEIRLILRGGSVIDWRRLNFRTYEEVDAFLRLCLFRPGEAADDARMRAILEESVEYLRSVFRYRVADVVAEPDSIHELFLIASDVGPHRKWRRIACIVLKVMHTLFHTDSREMLHRLPIASEALARRVDERVRAWAAALKESGAPVVEFTGSVKTRESTITKLLSKRESVATQIFDKVRYRIITEEKEDILSVINHLTTHLVPFNLVVPAQTENTLLSFSGLIESIPSFKELVPELQLDPYEATELEWEKKKGKLNEFSGKTYRVLNFIADVPVRLDDFQAAVGLVGQPKDPAIVFVPVEFQFLDRETARENEIGENSHERYKRRQQLRVLRRLSRGLVVPRRLGREKDGGDQGES